MKSTAQLPLVYSCSGASSAAQAANHIALKLDRLKVAEMSCIAGVGGDVKPLVRTAKSGRPIVALDGCPLHCAAHILRRHGLTADRHYDLSKMGIAKKQHEDFDPADTARVLKQILADPALPGRAAPDPAPLAKSSGAAAEEPREFASPPCYLADFEDDWHNTL